MRKKKLVRLQYGDKDVKVLRAHSKAKTPTVIVAKLMKRSVGSLQQKCRRLGIPLGHRPYGKKKALKKNILQSASPPTDHGPGPAA